MAEKSVDLEAVTRMVADKIALAHAMFDRTGRAPFIEFGFSDAEDVRGALERAERVEAAAREADHRYEVIKDWLVVDTDLAGRSCLTDAALFGEAMRLLHAGLAPAPGEEGK